MSQEQTETLFQEEPAKSHDRREEMRLPSDFRLGSYLGEEALLKALPELEDFRKVAHWLAQRFWSEGIAGNMSLRLSKLTSHLQDQELPQPLHKEDLLRSYPKLAGQFLAITGTGSRMRELGLTLRGKLGIIRINDSGDGFESYWGARHPSSELPAHLGIHNMLVSQKPQYRAVVHTHPTTTVTLSHIPELRSSKALNQTLFRLHPETRILIPEGIVYLDFDVPGSYSLGELTARGLESSRLVVWAHHGVVSVGENLLRAFDWVELVEKAATIYWRSRAMGIQPAGIPEEGLKKTVEAFKN